MHMWLLVWCAINAVWDIHHDKEYTELLPPDVAFVILTTARWVIIEVILGISFVIITIFGL